MAFKAASLALVFPEFLNDGYISLKLKGQMGINLIHQQKHIHSLILIVKSNN